MPRKRRSSEKTFSGRHRIILHTGDHIVVGQAQWQHHIGIGNLTRVSPEVHHQELFARDSKVALVRRDLIAFEDERTGELRFEARRGMPVPPPGAPSIHRQQFEAFLLMEPTLPASAADERMRALAPRLDVGDKFDPQGAVILY